MADQLDSLERAVELINEDCVRLVKERDELRLQISELKAQQYDRRTRPRG
jgi:chorismate mutase